MRSSVRISKIKNSHASRVKAFTLIETVMVATIFSIIAMGLGSCFLAGMKIWQRVKNINLAQYDTVLSLEKISRELRQSQDLTTIGFTGKANEVIFPILTGNSILKVTYRFNPEEKSLIRGQVDLKYILEGKEEEKYSEKKFASLDEFSLSYLKFDSEKEEYVWVQDWAKELGIFAAIKLQGKLKGEEYNKTIFIPIFSKS